jgi:dTDP-glucose 4,6-dehydratase
MHAVVTGGAGFLGSHLTDILLARGDRVTVVDNLLTGSLDNLAHLKGNELLSFDESNVSDYISVEGPVDYVFHFASPASPVDFERFPIPVLKVGALGTHNALGLAKAKGAKFLLASTSEVYGDPLVHPQPETYWGNVNPIGPRAVYDEAKRFAEAMTTAYRTFHGMDTRIVRFFNTYGPRMRADDGRVVPNFIHQALTNEPITIYGDGSYTRSFGYYADILDGVMRLADSSYKEPVNLGSHEELTMLEFADLIIGLTGSRSKVVHLPGLKDDPQRRHPVLHRAYEKLGWSPTTTIADGMAITIEYFKKRLKL